MPDLPDPLKEAASKAINSVLPNADDMLEAVARIPEVNHFTHRIMLSDPPAALLQGMTAAFLLCYAHGMREGGKVVLEAASAAIKGVDAARGEPT